jgi:hypothetical protein
LKDLNSDHQDPRSLVEREYHIAVDNSAQFHPSIVDRRFILLAMYGVPMVLAEAMIDEICKTGLVRTMLIVTDDIDSSLHFFRHPSIRIQKKSLMCWVARVKYFLIKSFNFEFVEASRRDGVWVTKAQNATVLTDAFHDAEEVLLIFSVNQSYAVQGYVRELLFKPLLLVCLLTLKTFP